MPSILVTIFLVKSTTKSPIFSVSSHQNVLYSSVGISIFKCLSQLNYTAHFGDLKQKNWFKIGDLVSDFTKKLLTRMGGAPYYGNWILNSSPNKKFWLTWIFVLHPQGLLKKWWEVESWSCDLWDEPGSHDLITWLDHQWIGDKLYLPTQ